MDFKGAGPAEHPCGGVWAEFGHGRVGGEDRATGGEVRRPGTLDSHCPSRRYQECPSLKVARLFPAQNSRAGPRRSEPDTCVPYGRRSLSRSPGLLTSPGGSHSSSTCRGLACPPSFLTAPMGCHSISHCGTQVFPLHVSPQCPLLNQEIKPESALLSAGPGRAHGPPPPSSIPIELSYPFILSTSEGCGERLC